MLNYELSNNSYKITTTHGGKLIGYFIPDIDGFYYFRPEEGDGYWTEYALLDLGNKLKELNQDLYDELKKFEDKDMERIPILIIQRIITDNVNT